MSILTAIVGLKLSGQTINTMTLGGLALAIGMLVDDATVEIENIDRNRAMGKPCSPRSSTAPVRSRRRHWRRPLDLHRLLPGVAAWGPAKFLFVPLALAVVFSMLTSYLLSRTLVPTMARYLLSEYHEENVGGGHQRWWKYGLETFVTWFRRALRSVQGRLPDDPGEKFIGERAGSSA